MQQGIDKYGLYMGLLQVHYMCDESGAFSGLEREMLMDFLRKSEKRCTKRRC
jgi:hypothetical protein